MTSAGAKIFDENMPLARKKTKVPSYLIAYYKLGTGDFLTLRDEEADGAYEQFIGENTNLALICALLVTTFLPLYYSEVSRLSIPDEGLTIDIETGQFRSWLFSINKAALHDFFDITYVLAMAGMFFGTLTCVYFILMANEAGTDERVIIYRRQLGIVARFPYYFFSLGAYSWGFSVYCHFLLVPRTLTGWIVKVTLVILATLAFAGLVLPISCKALYSAFAEEEEHPPKSFSTAQLSAQLKTYFADVTAAQTNDFNLKDFLHSLRQDVTKSGYRIPLLPGVEFEATHLFYRRLAEEKDMTFDQVIQLEALMKKK